MIRHPRPDSLASRILAHVREYPGDLDARAVARDLGETPARVTATAAELQRAGHILPHRYRLLPGVADRIRSRGVEGAAGAAAADMHVRIVAALAPDVPLSRADLLRALDLEDGAMPGAVSAAIRDLHLWGVVSPAACLWAADAGGEP